MNSDIPFSDHVGDAELEQLEQYLAGEMPDAEAAGFRSLVEGYDEKAIARLDAAAGAFRVRGGEDSDTRIQSIKKNLAPESKGDSSSNWLHRWMAYGVTACLLAVVSLQLFPLKPNTSESGSKDFTLYQTLPGQRARITLADGSTVLLAAESRLRVAKDFGKVSRDIDLTGEALFTVSSHTGSPFTVRTGNATTRVLGTTFGVRNYAGDVGARVIVAEGKVSLNNAILTTGTSGTIARDGNVKIDANTNTGVALAWTLGTLSFNEMPLRDVIAELHRWYGLQVQVTDQKMLSYRVTTSLQTESPAQGIDLIAQLLEARVTRSGNVVTFTPR